MIKKIKQGKVEDIYENKKKNRILRDYLAIDRTILANERTFIK